MILDPNYMDVIEWTDRLNSFVEIGTGTAEKLEKPSEWKEWALSLVGDPDDIGQDTPNPYDYDNWREWAMLFFLTQELN